MTMIGNTKQFSASINGLDFVFQTEPECFSPSTVDRGTLAMLSCLHIARGDKVLDLGCGYGVVGIYAAHFTPGELVFLCDMQEEAVRCARTNAELNHVENVSILIGDAFTVLKETDFDHIISNPPYHADFSVPKRFIEKGFNRLKLGGKIWMVTKREIWYKNKLTAIFGGVKTIRKDGYFVFEAEKRSMTYANILQNK